MKTSCLILCATLFTAFIAEGQGTLIYDQQSATNQAGGGGTFIEDQPLGQSFIPSLSAVGFIQLEFADSNPGNSLGATVYVNLWSGSISNGTLLSSTDPVFMPNGAFDLVTNFIFSTSVTVTPGVTYYIQPLVIQPGSDTNWALIGSTLYNYSGGTAIVFGNSVSSLDLWFREGVIDVPEPSSAAIMFLGGGLFVYARRKCKKLSRA
jgi:hypothetical protein